MKNLFDFVLNGSRDLVEQTRAHEIGFKQLQDGTRFSSKRTPRSKRNRSKENHKKGKDLQRKIAWLVWEMRLIRGWAFFTCLKRPPKM